MIDEITFSVPQPVYFRWRRKLYSYYPSNIAVCGRHGNGSINAAAEEGQRFVPPCCWRDVHRKYGWEKEWWFFGRTLADAMTEARRQHEIQELMHKVSREEVANG